MSEENGRSEKTFGRSGEVVSEAFEEFEVTREKNDSTYLSDVGVKGWLSALETTPLLKRFVLYWAWEKKT